MPAFTAARRIRPRRDGVAAAEGSAGILLRRLPGVAEAIDTAGLQSFYAQRDARAAERPLDRSVERWRRIAADANAEGLVRTSARAARLRFSSMA
jgi:hypothetical protein